MSSVTARIREVKQPMGGYIRPSQFVAYPLGDGRTLSESENIHATVVGMAVDYLTRLVMGTEDVEAFRISCQGAMYAEELFGQKGTLAKAAWLLSGIKGLDDRSIINACKIAMAILLPINKDRTWQGKPAHARSLIWWSRPSTSDLHVQGEMPGLVQMGFNRHVALTSNQCISWFLAIASRLFAIRSRCFSILVTATHANSHTKRGTNAAKASKI